jgi:ElaB/YqjD/DUF883 family membrane-anchored ribosome-binding protein
MGETVDALAYKADVPARSKEWIGEKKDAVTSKVGDVTPDTEQMKRRMAGMKRGVERNPLGLALGGAAVGFVAGLLLPSTRMEDEHVGPLADDLKSSAADAGREAMERGREAAQQAGRAAVETADAELRSEPELSSSLRDHAREAAGSTREPSSPDIPGR